MPDAKITHAIEEALAADERTAGQTIHVKTVAGVVFLDGEIEEDSQREAVAEIASRVAGVRFVQNRLQVNPSDQPGGWRERLRHPEEG